MVDNMESILGRVESLLYRELSKSLWNHNAVPRDLPRLLQVLTILSNFQARSSCLSDADLETLVAFVEAHGAHTVSATKPHIPEVRAPTSVNVASSRCLLFSLPVQVFRRVLDFLPYSSILENVACTNRFLFHLVHAPLCPAHCDKEETLVSMLQYILALGHELRSVGTPLRPVTAAILCSLVESRTVRGPQRPLTIHCLQLPKWFPDPNNVQLLSHVAGKSWVRFRQVDAQCIKYVVAKNQQLAVVRDTFQALHHALPTIEVVTMDFSSGYPGEEYDEGGMPQLDLHDAFVEHLWNTAGILPSSSQVSEDDFFPVLAQTVSCMSHLHTLHLCGLNGLVSDVPTFCEQIAGNPASASMLNSIRIGRHRWSSSSCSSSRNVVYH